MKTPTLKLYEISDQYLEAMNALSEIEDLDSDIVKDTLDGIYAEFRNKALNIAKYIKSMEAEADAVKKTIDDLTSRYRKLQKQSKFYRDYLKNEIEKIGPSKKIVSDSEIIVKVRKNNFPTVVIENEEILPEEFKKEVITIKVSKTDIRNYIKENQKSVPGVSLVFDNHLKII